MSDNEPLSKRPNTSSTLESFTKSEKQQKAGTLINSKTSEMNNKPESQQEKNDNRLFIAVVIVIVVMGILCILNL